MADQTKSCMLTEFEIKTLIGTYGSTLWEEDTKDEKIERINYLNKRLKSFKEVELTEVKSSNTAAGWSNANG